MATDRGTVPSLPVAWQWQKDLPGPVTGKDYGVEVTSFYGAKITSKGALQEVRQWNYNTQTWDLVPGL